MKKNKTPQEKRKRGNDEENLILTLRTYKLSVSKGEKNFYRHNLIPSFKKKSVHSILALTVKS